MLFREGWRKEGERGRRSKEEEEDGETGRCTKDGQNVAVWHEERCDKENPEICVELSGCFWLVPQEQTEEEGKRRMGAWRRERRMGVKGERRMGRGGKREEGGGGGGERERDPEE